MDRERVSYLYSRDPSVDRRFRPRPVRQFVLNNAIEEDDYDESTESQSSLNTTDSEAAVYLRMKPVKTSFETDLYKTNGHTFIVQNIEATNTGAKDRETEKHYEFSRIFDEMIDQTEIYNNCVSPYIVAEEDLTVLTYGTSGSGKTYTMHGTEENPGLIYRAIEQIFCHYGNEVTNRPVLQNSRGDVIVIRDSNIVLEEAKRQKYIKQFSKDDFQSSLERIRNDHGFQRNIYPSSDRSVVVWVSFAEMYNEFVYDLLEIEDHKQIAQKRKHLKIISNDGSAFIKDLISVHVRNAEDAYAILKSGRQRAQVASTNINCNSSRSHCIFMIDIVTLCGRNVFETISYKFCDLAGSERLKKTDNMGQRLKEAQGINTSLMVLGRCLDTTYQNQLKKGKDVVPFRESKLTTLLQAPLQGREKIITIVNMCPSRDFLEENLHVLGFSSIAQKIVPCLPKPPKRRNLSRRSTRFSYYMATSSPRTQNASPEAELNYLTSENMKLEEEIMTLREALEAKHVEQMRNEQVIRTTLVDQKEAALREVECVWRERYNTLKKQNEQLEDENQQLKMQLRKQTESVINIDDDDDEEEDDDVDDEEEDEENNDDDIEVDASSQEDENEEAQRKE